MMHIQEWRSLPSQDNTCRIWKDNFFTPAEEEDQCLGLKEVKVNPNQGEGESQSSAPLKMNENCPKEGLFQ